MTLEELTAAFADYKKTSSVSISALETANTEKDAELERLRGHQSKLLADLKKAKGKKTKTADEDGDEADDETDTSGNSDLRRVQDEHARKVKALEDKLAKAESERNSASVNAAMKDALDKARVAPQYRTAVEALFKTSRKVEVTESGVTIDGKPASEAFGEWAASEEGKVYIAAPSNGGGTGAPGTRPHVKPQGGDGMVRSKMSFAARAAYAREHGQAAYAKLPA